MTWGDHVEAISTKINQRLGLLKRISHLLPLETWITALFNSLVRPLFDYGHRDTIWGDKGNATVMTELQLLQNNAAKIILSLPSFKMKTSHLLLTFYTLSLSIYTNCIKAVKHGSSKYILLFKPCQSSTIYINLFMASASQISWRLFDLVSEEVNHFWAAQKTI